ncbi:hypothetical protein MKZ38_010063 [Zalerion maritima]|uniref:BZIP transcription factor n=1 Tax=Zalerion maritima TaxID=339359 RepID=A0AAD5RSM9_9PEZI|nr:hypothetical protein MKZ38_010063 [Zalerion maritima]
MERSDSSGASSMNDPTRTGPDASRVEDEYYEDEDEEQVPMSPRKTNDDIEALGREAREEMRRHAQALQESLLNIFNRIEAVKEEHDKLDSHNKFLQKYIGDLMSTSKITASGSRSKK